MQSIRGHNRASAILYFLFFLVTLFSCAADQYEVHFYEGLKKRQSSVQASAGEAVSLFEKALDSANGYTAAAAASELLRLRDSGVDVTDASVERAQQKIPPVPDDTAGLVAIGMKNGAIEEKAGIAALTAIAAVSHFRYGEALVSFRAVMTDSPELFFRYPDLIAGLGRCFQYAPIGGASRQEGITVLLEWEAIVSGNGNSAWPAVAMREAVSVGAEGVIRFRLLFFAARITRTLGGNSIELFEQALVYAPNDGAEQTDACLWYILDSSAALGPEAFINQLKIRSTQWHDDDYFYDITEKFARELILKQQWQFVLQIFAIVKDRPGAAAAQYAWIIGRAIDEQLLGPQEIQQAAAVMYDMAAGSAMVSFDGKNAVPMEKELAAVYKDIAGKAGINALYYRFLDKTAGRADEKVLPESAEQKDSVESGGTESDILRFLLGFFTHNAAEFAAEYIRELEDGLSPDALRQVAAALHSAGQYRESIRLISLYAGKNNDMPERRDWELWYPRPYKKLIEQYAAETDIEPALLFGLIRTESAFDSDAVSHAGAVGLTQLMPATAEETAARIHREGGPDYGSGSENGVDLTNPAANIHIGAAYLSYLNGRMEDSLLALLAYNGGMSRIRRWRSPASGGFQASLPPDLFLETVDYTETREYGRRVMAAAAVYRELYYQ